MRYLPSIIFLPLTVIICINAYADNSISNDSKHAVSRYVTVSPIATVAQKNPLKGVVEFVRFNRNIKTVGQAIHSLLSTSGYRLAPKHPDPRIYRMFSLRLPDIHRNMGPLTLENALSVLAGEPWALSVDPIERYISFELPDLYQLKQQKIKKVAYVSKRKPVKRIHKPIPKKVKSKRKVYRKKFIAQSKKVVAKRKPERKIMNLTWSDLPDDWKKQ